MLSVSSFKTYGKDTCTQAVRGQKALEVLTELTFYICICVTVTPLLGAHLSCGKHIS